MMVHRLLARYLEGGKTTDKAAFEALCEHASEREVIAAEAERASIKYKMVEFMQARLGEEFAGHISGITEWGIFVEIDENHIEGLVAMRDMHDDFYDFDPAEYTVTARRAGASRWAMPCASASSAPICKNASSTSTWCYPTHPAPTPRSEAAGARR